MQTALCKQNHLWNLTDVGSRQSLLQGLLEDHMLSRTELDATKNTDSQLIDAVAPGFSQQEL